MDSAELQIRDARVSEAHAMVSLRGQQLQLLALRGVLLHDRKVISKISLHPGVEVHLAKDLSLHVKEIRLPKSILALQLLGHAPVPLTRPTYSIVTAPEPVLIPRYEPGAAAHVWSAGGRWCLQTAEGVRDLEEGVVPLGRTKFIAIFLPVQGTQATLADFTKPIRIIARYSSVVIQRDGAVITAFGGIPAKILSELVALGGAAQWMLVAREIWGGDIDTQRLRARWDKNLGALRRRLAESGIGRELVTSCGDGTVEICLSEEDEMIDEN